MREAGCLIEAFTVLLLPLSSLDFRNVISSSDSCLVALLELEVDPFLAAAPSPEACHHHRAFVS
jgi:hypothetical protein